MLGKCLKQLFIASLCLVYTTKSAQTEIIYNTNPVKRRCELMHLSTVVHVYRAYCTCDWSNHHPTHTVADNYSIFRDVIKPKRSMVHNFSKCTLLHCRLREHGVSEQS